MIDKVKKYIEEQSLLPDYNAPVIVALSGGADSVALLHILSSLGYDCIAAHCNFHLRGAESDRDEHYAQSVASLCGAEFRKIDFNVREYMDTHKVSVEMACRDLRYSWFREIKNDSGAKAIAVGHHRDDNIETMMLNLLRGTGIDGASGMKARNGDIIRPLLCVSRKEIEEYLNRNEIAFMIDHTNLENDFLRNRLRNVILPQIYDLFPQAPDTLTTTLSNLRDTADFLESEISKMKSRYISHDGAVSVDRVIQDYPSQCRFILFEMLKDQGMNSSVAQDIIKSQDQSGKFFHVGDTVYLLDRGLLKKYSAVDSFSMPVDITKPPFGFSILKGNDFSHKDIHSNTIFLDKRVLDGDPVFELRSWREGDRLAPFGMKGTKKLSDIFSDAKLSVDEKRRVRILTRNGEILWVIGLRASRHFAVTPSTDYFIELSYNL